MAPTRNNNHHLSHLPLELKLKIISHLPSSSYESLSQTSTQIRLLFRTHKADICNNAIRTQFHPLAKLLQSTLSQGFLTPSLDLHTHIQKMHLDARLESLPSLAYAQDQTTRSQLASSSTPIMEEKYLYYLSLTALQINIHREKQNLMAKRQRVPPPIDPVFEANLDFVYTFCYIYYLSLYSATDVHMKAFKGLDINGEKAEVNWVLRRLQDKGNGLGTHSLEVARVRKKLLMSGLMEKLGLVECMVGKAFGR